MWNDFRRKSNKVPRYVLKNALFSHNPTFWIGWSVHDVPMLQYVMSYFPDIVAVLLVWRFGSLKFDKVCLLTRKSSQVSWFSSLLRHGGSADRGTDRRVQGGLLLVRQGRRWNHHHEGVGNCHALFGSESDRSRTSRYDQWGQVTFCLENGSKPWKAMWWTTKNDTLQILAISFMFVCKVWNAMWYFIVLATI